MIDTEVADLINSLKDGKSSGPNSLPTSILKLVRNTISNPLCKILNNSFVTGTFPDIFKLAKVIPVFKKGSKLKCSNYRPISLLSNISKLFEKIMHKRLYSFLNKFNCLYKYQFGFRHKHSTTQALLEITENIRKALDNRLFACGIFVDLQKAFDTVNHDILLSKLSYYGVRGIPLQWFRTYLLHRKQFVNFNGTQSDVKMLSFGVPQGSILGPLLFLIYINDLNKSIKYADAYHFADDTNLLLISKSLKKLNKYINHDLANLVQWLRANKISLNTKKTELILFKSLRTDLTKRNNKLLPKCLNFRISGQRIHPSKTIKYLGVLLDENLSFKPHLNELSLKLNRSNGMLAKIRHFVNLETLISIYHAIFGSHLRYACQIWGQTRGPQLAKIASLQNRAMKIIFFQPYNFDCKILYNLSNILHIYEVVEFLNCLFVWDQQHLKLPKAFDNLFSDRINCGHNLRSVTNNNLTVPIKQTFTYGINSITYQCILSWNTLPNEIKINPIYSRSRSAFSKAVFEHLHGKYN